MLRKRLPVRISEYLKANLLLGLTTPPTSVPVRSVVLIPFFAVFALVVGFSTGIFEYKPLDSKAILYLPITLFFLPSVLEEVIFRGILLPRLLAQESNSAITYTIALNTLVFVIYHPFMALLNPVASVFFFNPYFLAMVAFLSLTCSVSYIFSKSLWVPIVIHWLAVVVWVVGFGGRNLVLD